MSDPFRYTQGRAAGFATVSGTSGSFAIASANAGYVAIPRYINGIASGGASIVFGYGTSLGTNAWGPIQLGPNLPVSLWNLAPYDSTQSGKALVMNVGGAAGTAWFSVMYEIVKNTGTTS